MDISPGEVATREGVGVVGCCDGWWRGVVAGVEEVVVVAVVVVVVVLSVLIMVVVWRDSGGVFSGKVWPVAFFDGVAICICFSVVRRL